MEAWTNKELATKATRLELSIANSTFSPTYCLLIVTLYIASLDICVGFVIKSFLGLAKVSNMKFLNQTKFLTFFLSTYFTLWGPETSQCLLIVWQTVKTQKKCRIMWPFIRVCTVCIDKIILKRKKYMAFWKLWPVISQYIQRPFCLYCM